MKDKTRATIMFWVNLIYKPLMLLAGFTKNKLDDIILPFVKTVIDKVLSIKKEKKNGWIN